MARLPTRAEVRERGNRGPSIEDLEMQRLLRIASAAKTAFAAGSLLDAQEAIGVAIPGLVTTITLSAPFNSPTGASPQTTALRTCTVAAGNPGAIRCEVSFSASEPTVSVNGGAFTPCENGLFLSVDTTNTLQFRLTGASRTASVTLWDGTTNARIDGPFTITNS